jgi:hypothetical protein
MEINRTLNLIHKPKNQTAVQLRAMDAFNVIPLLSNSTISSGVSCNGRPRLTFCRGFRGRQPTSTPTIRKFCLKYSASATCSKKICHYSKSNKIKMFERIDQSHFVHLPTTHSVTIKNVPQWHSHSDRMIVIAGIVIYNV